MISDKEIQLNSDILQPEMFGLSNIMKPLITYNKKNPRAISLGFIVLDNTDKFSTNGKGDIFYNSIDDGKGRIRIVSRQMAKS
jgi:hypothetical protein